jgi:hypothetical protein
MRIHASSPFQQLLRLFLKNDFLMKINVLKSAFDEKTYFRENKCGGSPILADRRNSAAAP